MTTASIARVIAWAEARRMRVEVDFSSGRIVLTGTLWVDGIADMANPCRQEFEDADVALEWQEAFSAAFHLKPP